MTTGRRGRPRKWASEADRQRAYRQRKAAELAEPLKLREQLSETRRSLKSATGKLQRRDSAITELGTRLAELEAELAAAQQETERLRAANEDLANAVGELRRRERAGWAPTPPTPTGREPSAEPGAATPQNRQQRRAAERKRKRRS